LRFATLTNFTETIEPTNPPRPSRGKLVKDFLDYEDGKSVEEHLRGLEEEKEEYAGFNLLVAELRLPSTSSSSSTSTRNDPLTIGYCSNRETTTKKARTLPSFERDSKVRGLSNATLEAEPGEEVWPKVKSGCLSVEEAVKGAEEKGEEKLVEKLWETLRCVCNLPPRSRLQCSTLDNFVVPLHSRRLPTVLISEKLFSFDHSRFPLPRLSLQHRLHSPHLHYPHRLLSYPTQRLTESEKEKKD